MTDDELFDLADSATPSDTNTIEQGAPFVIHSTYSGSNSDPQLTPGLILLILSPPGEPLPPHGMPDRGGVPIVDGGAGMRHLCGITASHLGPGKGMKVIKLYEDESLTGEKKITLPLRAGGRVAPMGSWGSRGTPRPCNWG